MNDTTAETTANANKPVFFEENTNGRIAVFLNTSTVKTGERAGESYDYFTYRNGDDAINVPTRVGGYNLQNRMTRSEKFSDVVDLVNGRELVVWGRGANGEYPMILAPVGTKERIHDGKTYKNLQVVAALAEFARGADPRKDVPRAFLINSIEDGKLSETRNVKCYRCVSAKHPGSRSVYLPIRVENAVEAVRSLASGKPYSFELDDFRISLEGIDIVPAKAGPVKVLRFRAESLQQENAHENSAPLPQRQTPERRSRAL